MERIEGLDFRNQALNTREALAKYDFLLRQVVRKLTKVAKETGALDEEDLMNEARLALVEGLSKFSGEGHYDEQRFLALRVRHRLIDCIRRLSPYTRDELARQPEARRLVPLEASHEALASTSRNNPEELLREREQAERLDARMQQLPTAERAAFGLSCEGFRLRDIGDQLGVSESRAFQLRQGAVRRLQRNLRSVRPKARRYRATTARTAASQ